MDERRTVLPTFKDRLRLGSHGLQISPFIVGMVEDPAVVSEAYDMGVNAFFVTADMHWPLYEPLRKGLAQLFARGGGVRDNVVVFGCSYVAQPEFGFAPFQEILEVVPGLDRIDTMVVGGAYALDARLRAERFRAQTKKGFVGAKAVGVTFHERIAAAQLVDHDCLDMSLIRYNAIHPGAYFDFFPHVPKKRHKLVFNFKSTLGHVSEELARKCGIEDDVWLPSCADHYRFVLTRSEFDGVLCAPRNRSELEGIAKAMSDGPLGAEDENHFIALAEAVGAKRSGV